MRVSLGDAGLRPLLAFVATRALSRAGAPWTRSRIPLVGPAETGISVALVAPPDTVNADGVSPSTVQLTLRNSDGSPLSGLAVYFVFSGDGELDPSSSSTYVGPVQTGIVMATNNSGAATVVYVAGTAFRSVTVVVRPYNFDGANAYCDPSRSSSSDTLGRATFLP